MSWMKSLVLAGLISTQAFAAIKPSKIKQADASVSVIDVLTLPSNNQLQAAVAHKQSLIPELKNFARDEKQAMDLRWKSLSLLAALSPVQVVSELDYFINAKEWYMRNAALLIADKYFPDKGGAFARQLLKDKALVVRSAAVDVLSAKLQEVDRDLLWQESAEQRNYRHKKSLWIRAKIILALAKDPTARDSAMFQSLLKDSEFKIQVASIKALEKIHSKKLGVATDSVAVKAELWRKFAKASNIKN